MHCARITRSTAVPRHASMTRRELGNPLEIPMHTIRMCLHDTPSNRPSKFCNLYIFTLSHFVAEFPAFPPPPPPPLISRIYLAHNYNQGLPRTWTAEGTSGGSRIARLPSGAALHTLEGPADPRMSYLLVHDISEHGGAHPRIHACVRMRTHALTCTHAHHKSTLS